MSVELAINNWLEMKAKARGSKKTERAYADVIRSAREELLRHGLDLDGDTEAVGIALEAWARRRWSGGGGDVAPATYNQRLSILDSFYKLVLKYRFLTCDNPVKPLGRENILGLGGRTEALDVAVLRKQLAAIDRSSPAGLRDYALLLLALHTGRRATELASLRWGHLRHSGDSLTIAWPYVKGNVGSVQDTVYGAVREALLSYLIAIHGPRLATLPSDTPVWLAMDFYARSRLSGRLTDSSMSIQALEMMMKRRLGTSKLNATRITMGVPLPASIVANKEIAEANHEPVLSSTDFYLSSMRR
jgi:integrase